MFREYRRKWVRKNRFRPWYRKCRHYLSKRGEIGRTIKTFCGDLGPLKQLRLRTDMIWSLFCYGAYFSEYFLFGFEGKPRAYRNSDWSWSAGNCFPCSAAGGYYMRCCSAEDGLRKYCSAESQRSVADDSRKDRSDLQGAAAADAWYCWKCSADGA